MIENVNVLTYNKSDVILFNSHAEDENVILSNLYDKCVIDYDGEIFHSSEQLFFWLLLEGNEKGRKRILNCETAKKANASGKYYLHKDKWDDTNPEVQKKEVQALRIAIGEKMRCCSEFRNIVLGTNKKIVEYAWWGDDGYGCVDLDPRNKYNWTRGQVRGQNICGRLIMEWRKKYLNSIPYSSSLIPYPY